MKFTVLGASGFIGSNLVQWLQSQRLPYWAPGRGEDVLSRPLGHVIYCIGVTSDFIERPIDTIQAHVCYLSRILQNCNFTSLLYLSSTRVYGSTTLASEDAAFKVDPQDKSDIYNLSKLTGEALCMAMDHPTVRVARLSNVYGGNPASPAFLESIIRDAIENGYILLKSDLDSSKDYINIDDVTKMLFSISSDGKQRIYNLASGINIRTFEIVRKIKNIIDCKVDIMPDAPIVSFPPIQISRIRQEFNFKPKALLDHIEGLVVEYKQNISKEV